MIDVESVPAPAHQPDEAPVSSELREQAGHSLEMIKQQVQEARDSGKLSQADELRLMTWLAEDVQAKLAEADQHDAERHAFMASGVVNDAVTPTVTTGEGVMTPGDKQSEVAFRQEHGHPSNETATQI